MMLRRDPVPSVKIIDQKCTECESYIRSLMEFDIDSDQENEAILINRGKRIKDVFSKYHQNMSTILTKAAKKG